MLSTDSSFTESSFSSAIRNPLSSFYRPSRFDATNLSNKFNIRPYGDELDFFGKLTKNSQFGTDAYDPSTSFANNRFRFRDTTPESTAMGSTKKYCETHKTEENNTMWVLFEEIDKFLMPLKTSDHPDWLYAHQQDPHVNGLFLKNLDNSFSNDRIRYNPYSSASKNQRLKKIFYKSMANTDDLSPLPNKFAGFSIQDKLAHLKKTINGMDTMNLANKTNNTNTAAETGRDLHNLSSSLSIGATKRFNHLKTSTPMLGSNAMDSLGIRLNSLETQKKVEHNNKTVSQIVPEETPCSSRKETVSTISARTNHEAEKRQSEKPSFFSFIRQWWSGRKYSDEQEDRRKEAQNLEKELSLREKSRHNRQLSEEEDRRVRLQLEGLVLERRVPPKEEFPELSGAARHLVRIIWKRSAPLDEVFVSGFGADITRKDLLTLSGLEWLNDEVINFFLNLIVERNCNDPNLPNVYTFNTFFYQKLVSSGFAGVKRWTRKADIFSNDMLIVPVHLPNHWCMAYVRGKPHRVLKVFISRDSSVRQALLSVNFLSLQIIDFKEKRLEYYDSMLGSNEKCLHILSDYLAEESHDKRKEAFDFGGWTMECRTDIPHQTNFSDCGMFSLLFAEYASRRARITFTQKHIAYFRERMCYEICKKNLL